MIFYFLFDEEYREVEERSDVSVFKEKKNKKALKFARTCTLINIIRNEVI
ncbi:MAG: hypothetical protein K6E94_01960 [Elusimicrobiaceae bacterium]|nr:hypothetical protein [Elusimicrobiaceae bacterium]